MITTTTQPTTGDSPILSTTSTARASTSNSLVGRIKSKITTRKGWIGEYDYAWLCLPSLPCLNTTKRRAPPFYSLDADLPLAVAIFNGFQHALAMLAGLITPPIIFASTLNMDAQTSSYMVSASLISCGILSLVQMSRLRIWGKYYLGTGLLSVVGTSFATLSTANSVFDAMYKDGTCTTFVDSDSTVVRNPCPDAYGKVIGTSLVCSFLEIFMSFVSPRILHRVFPPLVTGTVILLIGASLIGSSGMPNWGGGSNACRSSPATGIFQLCPTTLAPRPLPWGSPEFVGLGFLSFITIILTEIFGSPFLRNISIIVGLAVGCIVAGAAGYIDGSSISSAPAITFLWVRRFKLGVYPPAILPMLAVYVSLAMEAIGDITATAEVSRLEVQGDEFDSRIQGGILADGIGGFFSALFTSTPLSVFAQNNGVIALTRCANITAGRWCAFILILLGTFSKLSGVLLAIPNPVLGGVTTFLFASVAVSGVRVLGYSKFKRRERFVLGAALALGIGDLMVPDVFTHLFDGVEERGGGVGKGLRGLMDSITIVLSTPFLLAGIVASILNLVLPDEKDEEQNDEDQGLEEGMGVADTTDNKDTSQVV